MPEPFVEFVGHADRVTSVAWLSDGRLASVSLDRTLKLWDAANGKLLRTLAVPGGPTLAVAAQPGGSLLATGGKDKTIRLWDLAAGADAAPLQLSGPAALRLAFSGDGRRLAACGEDESRIYVWEVAQPKAARMFQGEDPDDKNLRRSTFGLAFHPERPELASGGADRSVRQWDLEAGKETRRLAAAEYAVFREKDKKVEREVKRGASEFAVYAVAYRDDGRRLASGGLDKAIRIWDAATGELVRTLEKHGGFVQALQFLEGDRLFSCGHAGRLHLWDADAGRLEWSTQLPAWTAWAAVSADGAFAAAAAADGKAYGVRLPAKRAN